MYHFHTVVKLGDRVPFSGALIDLSFVTKIKFNKQTSNYELENSKLDIQPFGCEEYTADNAFTNGAKYSKNVQFGLKPHQHFNQVIPIKYAKILIQNKNITIPLIISGSKEIKLVDILKSKDNNKLVSIDYNSKNESFSMWYAIEFKLNSKNEGIFTVN